MPKNIDYLVPNKWTNFSPNGINEFIKIFMNGKINATPSAVTLISYERK